MPKSAPVAGGSYDARRGNSAQRGYDRQWRKYRKRFLANNPLCVGCEEVGRVTAAKVVDHIIPHRGNRQLFHDPANHQALCTRCHNIKTARGE